MKKETMHILLNIASIALGLAGLIFILLSIFTGKDTLKWGLLCVVLGSIPGFIHLRWGKKAT